MKTRTVLISLVSVMFVAAMTAMPVAADDHGGPGTYGCTTDVGLGIPGVLGLSLGDGLGGCTLIVTTEDTVVGEVRAAAGCSVNADQDGDGLGDPYEEGDTFVAGTSVFATCDLGTLDATSEIDLE